MSEQTPPSGPDFAAGISLSTLGDARMTAGRVGDDAVLLVRLEHEWIAVGARCTHYSGPLAEGLLVGDTVRCPWHHACFDLRSGSVLAPPALNPLPRWRVEQVGETLFVRERLPDAPALAAALPPTRSETPRRIVIVGIGAAGAVAVETLRAEGYTGTITVIDRDSDAPYDRPNISKDYLAGTAPEEWLPLRGPDFYRDHDVTIVRGTVASLDTAGRRVVLDDGSSQGYDALLLATGARPSMLPAALARTNVLYLRSLADSRRIKAGAATAKRAVVIGASFIGLEVAASLRTLGLDVSVVAPEEKPLARVFGDEIADTVRTLHEGHGVRFHLGRSVKAVSDHDVTLDDGTVLVADLVVAGIGVRPSTELAEAAGIACDNGILVDACLETSVPGVFAAGDVARWRTDAAGARARVEHWVLAERHGQTAARNMLGARVPFTAVPFFWSQHYDVAISYVGLAPQWDAHVVGGSPAAHDCAVTLFANGRRVAVATIGRDLQSLEAEEALESLSRTAAPTTPTRTS